MISVFAMPAVPVHADCYVGEHVVLASEMIKRLEELIDVAGFDPPVTIESLCDGQLLDAQAELQPVVPTDEGDECHWQVRDKHNTHQVVKFW